MGANLHDAMTIDLPEIDQDGLKIERFVIEPYNLDNLRNTLRGGRGTRPGTYTKLVIDGKLWMSDVDAERRDHMVPLWEIQSRKASRIMVNGLGLGMVVKAALTLDHVGHIDVIEADARVCKLIGPHYEASGRVTVHHADAYDQARAWPTGTRWDVGWSDIWGDPSEDDLPDMARLNRAYGRRCAWHRCWAQAELKAQVRREKAMGWGGW